MKKEPVLGLKPLNDCVLVELKQSYKNFTSKEKKHDSRTEGIVVATPDDKVQILKSNIEHPLYKLETYKHLLGKRIHFEEFKEGARITRNNKIYSFIKIEDIRGYEDEQTN
jgi:co-chaperonin GroES (HSP10)